jgi:diguanylate cyclase (GGDEF)-like protein
MAGAYPMLPAYGRRLDLLLASCGCLLVAAGALRRAATADRRLWWLLWGALVTMVAGNVTLLWALALPSAQPLVAVFYTAGSTLVFGAAVAVVTRTGRTDAGAVIDSMIVFMAAGGLLWSTVILPRLVVTHQGAAVQVSTFMTVFGLGAVVGAMTRLLRTSTDRAQPLWLLLVALTFPLVSQTVVVLRSGPATVAAAMTWLVAYAALGLFGLDRAATRVLQRGPVPPDTPTVGRLALRAGALATVPVVLGAQQLSSHQVGGLLLAVAGAIIAVLVTVRSGRSATEHARTERALLHRATHDALTGLPNRAEFMARLVAELRGPYTCLVLFCDLDGFKTVNDRFGHAAGDRLLVEVGRRLGRCVREHDTVARFGGDEFLILYREAGPADVALLCDRIRAALESSADLGAESVAVSASVGAVVSAGAGSGSGSGAGAGSGRSNGADTVESRAQQLIHHADEAMYAAKQRRIRRRNGYEPDLAPTARNPVLNAAAGSLVNAANLNWSRMWEPADLDTTVSFPTY